MVLRQNNTISLHILLRAKMNRNNIICYKHSAPSGAKLSTQQDSPALSVISFFLPLDDGRIPLHMWRQTHQDTFDSSIGFRPNKVPLS
jgi:hypothetical protein